MIWNNKDENIITYLMLLYKQLSGVTEKKKEVLSNDSQSTGTQFTGVLNMKQKFTLEAEKCVACSRTSNFNLPTSQFSVQISKMLHPLPGFSLKCLVATRLMITKHKLLKSHSKMPDTDMNGNIQKKNTSFLVSYTEVSVYMNPLKYTECRCNILIMEFLDFQYFSCFIKPYQFIRVLITKQNIGGGRGESRSGIYDIFWLKIHKATKYQSGEFIPSQYKNRHVPNVSNASFMLFHRCAAVGHTIRSL